MIRPMSLPPLLNRINWLEIQDKVDNKNQPTKAASALITWICPDVCLIAFASVAGAAPKICGLELRLLPDINVSSCFFRPSQSFSGI